MSGILSEGLCGQKEANIQSCKPDPEEQLQRIRKEMTRTGRVRELLLELDSLTSGLHDSEGTRGFVQLLGRTVYREHLLKKEEVYWLNEIDKG